MDELMTFGEAAAALNVGKSRISQLVGQGRLTVHEQGGRRMVTVSSVRDYQIHGGKRGRPKRLGSIYLIMNAGHEVMRVSYDPASDLPMQPIEVIDPLRCPWGTVTRTGTARRRELNEWWRGRSIPHVRVGIEEKVMRLGMRDSSELPFRSLGLSLSDSYWVREEGSAASWNDVNFFHNPFVDDHVEDWDDWLETVGLSSPDNTSEGALPKRWVIRGGTRTLLKGCRSDDQRPVNEAVATELHRRLLDTGEYVCYGLEHLSGGLACSCPSFIREGEEFIPASSVMQTIHTTRGTSFYDRYCRYVGTLGIDEGAYREFMAKMIVCDTILAGTDRHRRNFGFIRDVESLELRPAPLFDSGNCLWYQKSQTEVQEGNYHFSMKPFGPLPEQQLALVESAWWFDVDSLAGFADQACDLLAQSDHASQEGRLDYLHRGIREQIDTVTKIMGVLRYRS